MYISPICNISSFLKMLTIEDINNIKNTAEDYPLHYEIINLHFWHFLPDT